MSEDHDLYIWGGRAGEKNKISSLSEPADGEEMVKLVNIDGGVDVVDVGVGAGHVIALTGDGEVWVTGNGQDGQLGTGSERFEEKWVRIEGDWKDQGRVVAVGCGVWCSWVIVDTQMPSPPRSERDRSSN